MEENLPARAWTAVKTPDGLVFLDPHMSVGEALELLRRAPGDSLPVIRPETGEMLGLLSQPQALTPSVSPARLGGMATPLGVYLTDGVYSGGVGFWGLLLTGMTLGTLEITAQALTLGVSRLTAGAPAAALPLLSHAPPALQTWVGQMQYGFGPTMMVMALLFVLLRLLPMSGTHAAEHQVVHCVERGAPLVPACVRAMPRVHPRCGTNLVVGFALFQLVFLAVWSALQMSFGPLDAAALAAMAAAPATLLYWRRLGGWVQQWLTTRPATDRQIRGAIRAAEQVLRRRQEAHSTGRTRLWLPRRIWRMGLAQILLGYAAVFSLLSVCAHFWPRLGSTLGF